MASLRKKPNSGFWYACFNLPNGQRTQRSTKLNDRKAAQKLANTWEDASDKKVTEAQARHVLSDIYEDIHGQPLSSATFSAYATQWLARKKGEVSGPTFKAYEHAIEEFRGGLKAKANDQINYITVADIAAWRDASAEKASPATANNKLKVIRVFFQSAWRDGLVPENVAAKVQSLKGETSIRRDFTLDELKLILEAADEEWKGMILAGVYTGQRLKDIASLTWMNIDLGKKVLRLQTSKTGRNQIIPIAEPLRSYLSEVKTANLNAPVFPNAFKVASKSDISPLSQQFHDILVSAGLATARPPKHQQQGIGRSAPRARTEISFHSLRHTATSLLKNAGAPEAVARDIIGHESAAVSRHYTHVDEASKKAAIELLPDITKADKPTAKKTSKSSKKRRKGLHHDRS